MPPPAHLHSFVIRLWMEERAELQAAPHAMPLWRGHITHVGTQERRYVQALDDLTAFIRPFLVTDTLPTSPPDEANSHAHG